MYLSKILKGFVNISTYYVNEKSDVNGITAYQMGMEIFSLIVTIPHRYDNNTFSFNVIIPYQDDQNACCDITMTYFVTKKYL